MYTMQSYPVGLLPCSALMRFKVLVGSMSGIRGKRSDCANHIFCVKTQWTESVLLVAYNSELGGTGPG